MIAPRSSQQSLMHRLGRALQAHWWSPVSRRPPHQAWQMWVLAPLAGMYRALYAVHRAWAIRTHAPWTPAQGRDVPTVVVGNWVVGGAGKTPTTLALLRHLQKQGWTPGVISRGFGSEVSAVTLVRADTSVAHEVGDEPLLMARTAQVPVAVGRDRCAARRHLLEQHAEVDIVVADDGLQHHRLSRDLQVVVVDERGAGNGWCLPAGPLREPIPTQLPPNTWVLYSGGEPTLALPGYRGQRRLTCVQSLQDWQAGAAPGADGGWGALQGLTLHAAAGIAVPQRFFDLLEARGLNLAATYALPDHDAWTHAPWPTGTADAVITEKDAVKLLARPHAGPQSETRVWVARLDLHLPPEFLASVDARLQALRPPIA